MSRVFLVRHGDTDANSRERFWGKTDVGLSPAGVAQAGRLRDRLAAEKIDAIYSSRLKRARHTAEIIASRQAVPVVACDELCEINFGELEGLAFAEINQRYPKLTGSWARRDPDLTYPGGDNLKEFSRRVITFLPRLEKHAAEETILIVAHSGVLRTLLCQMLGIDLERRWQFRTDLASLSIVDVHPPEAVLTRLNDLCHLD
ncbi:MAG: alpha-ribazole phosphatase [Chloroflexota bacterium]